MVLSSALRFSNLASSRRVGRHGSQAPLASPHTGADSQVEAREPETDTAAPVWELSPRDTRELVEQPSAGCCRGAAGWVYELLAAACDTSNEFLFLCVNVLGAILQCV